MRASSLLLLLCVSVCGVCLTSAIPSSDPVEVATPPSRPVTLVLADDAAALQQTHSIFFQQLSDRGHQLSFVGAGTEKIVLEKFGRFYYDNLILMAPRSEELADGISVGSVQSFLDSGRSVLLVASQGVSEPVRELASELGIDIDDDGDNVIDHSQFDEESAGVHDIVLGQIETRAARVVGGVKGSVLYRGLGHVVAESEFLTPLLVGSASAIGGAGVTGAQVGLVSVLQAANNARVSFSGSMDLFSNAFLARHSGDSESVTASFVRNLSAWTFHERGLLRARQLSHFKVVAEHDRNPHSYRVSDELDFSIVIEEYDGRSDEWKAFSAADVQLEFTMLDPYLRVLLTPSAQGKFSTRFIVPDVYGVYKFVISYRRIGFSNLEVSHTVSVHPFRHDEYERFIVVAYPYYASAFSMMAAFFVFGLVFLYHKE